MTNPDAMMWLKRMAALILVCIGLVAAVQIRNMGIASTAAAPAEPETAARIKYVWATPTPTPTYATDIEVGYGEHILWTNLKDDSAREIWVNQPLAGNPPEVTFAPFGSNAGGVVLIMSPSGDPMVWTAAPNIDEALWFGIIKVILFPDHVRIESTDGAFAKAPPMPTPITIIQQVEVPVQVPVYIQSEPAQEPWTPSVPAVGPVVNEGAAETPVDMTIIFESTPVPAPAEPPHPQGGCGSLGGGGGGGCPMEPNAPAHIEPGQQLHTMPVLDTADHGNDHGQHDGPGSEHGNPSQ